MLYGGQVQVKRVASPVLEIRQRRRTPRPSTRRSRRSSPRRSARTWSTSRAAPTSTSSSSRRPCRTEKLELPVHELGEADPEHARQSSREAYWPELEPPGRDPGLRVRPAAPGNRVDGPGSGRGASSPPSSSRPAGCSPSTSTASACWSTGPPSRRPRRPRSWKERSHELPQPRREARRPEGQHADRVRAVVPGRGRPRAAYEIGVQRTADILDEGYEVFMRSSRSAMGMAGDSIVAIFTAAWRPGERLGRHVPARGHPADRHQVHPADGSRRTPASTTATSGTPTTPLYGGIHNPDQVAIMPVFFDGELVAWTAALVHTTETGACEPGGMPVSAKARFEEGMNLPPMKIGHELTSCATTSSRCSPRSGSGRSETGDRGPAGPLHHRGPGARPPPGDVRAARARTSSPGCSARCSTRPRQGCPASASQSWPDGTYRCVTFSDAAGMETGLLRNCVMTMTKDGDHLDGRLHRHEPGERRPRYNAHPQAVIGHLANYIYEYVFHDLPISPRPRSSRSTSCSRANSMLSPARAAATSCSVMVATGAMSAIANCVRRARFGTTEWRQVAAALGNGGNASVLAGVSPVGHAVRRHARLHDQHRGLTAGGRPTTA